MTPTEFYEATRALVDAVTPPHLAVNVGEAPDYGDGELFQPYVIVWPSPGAPVDEQFVDGRIGGEVTDLSFQVTTVAPDPSSLLYFVNQVDDALTDALINGRLIRPDTIANRAVRPLVDETLRPARHYLATTWQTQLTRSTNVTAETSMGR